MGAHAPPLIRSIADADLERGVDILAEAYRNFIQTDCWDRQQVESLVATQCTCSYLRELAATQQVLVAVWQDEVSGFLGLRAGEVTHLFIASSHQRHGLGSCLLAHAIALARAAGQERLRVFVAAFSALAFYQRSGFQAAGEISISGGPCRGRTAIRLVMPIS